MKNKYLFIYSGILISGICLTSCSYFSLNVKEPNKLKQQDDILLCPVVGGTVALNTLDGQPNMINPKYVDMSRSGNVSLKTDYKYSLSSNSWYTFVFGGDFNYLYRNGPKNCLGFNIVIDYPDGPMKTVKYECERKDSLDSIIRNTGCEKVKMSMREDCSYMFLSFMTPYTNQGLPIIKKCEFTLDDTYKNGKIVSTQLYKGNIESFKGHDLTYNHDVCLPSFDENFEGPFKNGYEYPLEFEYGQVPTAESLRRTLLAYDVSEGNYKDVTVLEDGLLGNESKLGIPLKVVFQSQDSLKNVSKFSYIITIKDTKLPEIVEKNTNRKISYSREITDELLLSNFTISDNHPSGIMNKEIVDFNRPSENFIGKIPFKVKAVDSSNNIKIIDSSIELIDDIMPEIIGPTELNLNANEPMNIDEILSQYKAQDEICGECKIVLVNENYSPNKKRPGKYYINIKTTDKYNNTATASIKAIVQDKEGPVFYVNKATIVTFSKKTLDKNSLLRSAITQGALPTKNYTSCEIIEGEYGFVDEVKDYGIYKVKLLAHASDDTSEIALLTIDVKEPVNKEIGIVEKIKMFFVDLWDRIINFFQKVF